MADALAKYRAALKRYRKENPNVAFSVAQKRVAAEMKSGKVSGPKKRKRIASVSHKTAIAGPRRKAASKRKPAAKKAATRSKTISRMDKSEKILRDIEKLELKRKGAKLREMKDVIQLEINALHDKLDAIKSSYRRKSA